MFNSSQNRFTIQNERIEVRRTHPSQTFQRKHRLANRHISEVDLVTISESDGSIEQPRRQQPDLSQFFSAKTIEQLIAEQGTQPITDLSLLSGAIPDEDLDEFV